MKKSSIKNHNQQFPTTLSQKLNQRDAEGTLRHLRFPKSGLIDFCSNDYLGLSTNEAISDFTKKKFQAYSKFKHGATGSRLLSGNYQMLVDFETYLETYYSTKSATVFNSGYDANLGLISSVGQRQDLILYDELSHASIRDGIALSKAKSYKFQHDDLSDLKEKLVKFKTKFETIYVITEHVFSMDGDCVDVDALVRLCNQFQAFLILDEAHSVGTISKNGYNGEELFARIITFGKAFGSHGAAVLGSGFLKHYLVNFARSFIYTTAPGIETTARNWAAHLYFESDSSSFDKLRFNIEFFRKEIQRLDLNPFFIESDSAIQSCVIGGNEKVKTVSKQLEEKGFDVRPILSPTVPKGKERLRFCLHSFNTEEELSEVLHHLSKTIN